MRKRWTRVSRRREKRMSVVSRIKCLFGKTSPTGTTLNLSSEVSKTEECHDQRLLLMGVIRAEAACLCEAHHIGTPAHVAGGAIELVQAMLAEHRDTAAEELPGIAIGGLSAFIYEWDRGMRSRGEMAMGDCGRSLDPCPCYGTGYAQGKDKAYWEIEVHDIKRHAWDCGCQPCLAYRQVADKLGVTLRSRREPPTCEVCGVEFGDPHNPEAHLAESRVEEDRW